VDLQAKLNAVKAQSLPKAGKMDLTVSPGIFRHLECSTPLQGQGHQLCCLVSTYQCLHAPALTSIKECLASSHIWIYLVPLSLCLILLCASQEDEQRRAAGLVRKVRAWRLGFAHRLDVLPSHRLQDDQALVCERPKQSFVIWRSTDEHVFCTGN
jgi:hypothetical protein